MKLWASHSLSTRDHHKVSTCISGTENNASALNFPLADSRVVSRDKSRKTMGPKGGIHDSLRSLHHVLLSDVSNHCQWSHGVIFFHPNKAQWVHVIFVLFNNTYILYIYIYILSRYLLCALHSSYTCFHLVGLVIKNVKIVPDKVKILVGETLKLNCTGETTFNGRFQIDWDFPRSKVSHFFSWCN